MNIWIYMLICNLLIPGIMLIAGWFFVNKPPQKINAIIGYRSTMSMKNEATWRFAHRYAGRLWWKWGWIALVLTLVAMLLVLGRSENVVSVVGVAVMALLLIPVIGVIPLTENALRRYFDKDGKSIAIPEEDP